TNSVRKKKGRGKPISASPKALVLDKKIADNDERYRARRNSYQCESGRIRLAAAKRHPAKNGVERKCDQRKCRVEDRFSHKLFSELAFLFSFSPFVPVSLLRPHVRKQNYVADRVAICEQHCEAVDTDADAGGRRHAVTQCSDVVFVEYHRFFVAAFALSHLVDKPLVLFARIVKFREAVG